MKKSIEEADELDGFEDLQEGDQEKVRKAWEEGHVADEDIPESARKPTDEEEEEGDEEKPKKKAAAKKEGKKAKAAASDEPGVFKFEYASSGRAKCKGVCSLYTVAHVRSADIRLHRVWRYISYPPSSARCSP